MKKIDQQANTSRISLIQHAFRLEWATVGWMVVEAVVAIWSGIKSRNLALIAFGADSGIELLSAMVLIWPLTLELKKGKRFSEQAERTASRIAGGLLFALAAYVTAAAVWSLWAHQGGKFSLPGLAVTALAIPIMDILARRKLSIAEALGSRALRADAIESVTCMYLACVALGALLAQFLLKSFQVDGWWIGPVASLGIVWFLVREGREAWSGEDD